MSVPVGLFKTLVLGFFLIGLLTCITGLGLSLTGIGAIIGIPLLLAGFLLLFASLFLVVWAAVSKYI